MRVRSKLGLVGMGALTLVGTFGVSAGAPAHADDLVHRLTLGGSTYITDDETFADEHCTRTLSGYDTAQLPMDNAANISDTNNKCGGEIRVEFHITAAVYSDGGFCVTSGRVLLYEGTSESTNDLDGTQNFGGCVAPGQNITITGTVHNTAEGGDKASYNIILTAS
jgi:hypothetical protein